MDSYIDYNLVDLSRWQFAITAMYHWIFVPLTIGLSFVIAIMESIYVRTNNPEWKRITKFWMTLFGINFAIGIATGIILEFQFGTNWSNYSWFVGDIFGAPLAIEGLMAFFLESTFIGVMFFGWNKVSKSFHLLSTWLVAIGASLSAFWILVANAWMQYPAGMHFNPDTVRNELTNFWAVAFSPIAINKFFHTISSCLVLSSVFVVGVSSWFLIKGIETHVFKKSMIIGAVFGFLSSILVILNGDNSAKQIAKYQPMKLAAMEAHYDGTTNSSLSVIAFVSSTMLIDSLITLPEFKFKFEVPGLLSLLSFNSTSAYVPGIKDLIYGNEKHQILSLSEKIKRGKTAKEKLKELRLAKENKDTTKYEELKKEFLSDDFKKNYFAYFGYSYINNPNQIIPNIPLIYYSFRIMVGLGFLFLLIFILTIWFYYKKSIEKQKWLLWLTLISIPLPYIAGECGWIVAEVGRQPWVVQDYLPTLAAVSAIESTSVQTTILLFVILFSALLIAEIKIMIKQIKIGPKEK